MRLQSTIIYSYYSFAHLPSLTFFWLPFQSYCVHFMCNWYDLGLQQCDIVIYDLRANWWGRLKTRDLTLRDHQNCGDWHRETGQRGTILQGWTSRDLLQCSSRCSLQVNVWFREYYMSCSSVLCSFLVLSVLLIAACGRLSWPALWTTFGRTIK